MADVPALGQVPQGSPGSPGVNAPESGTYGEKAAQQQLEAQLPSMPPSGGGPAAPPGPAVSPEPMTPPPAGAPGAPSGAPPPAGVPAAILQGGPMGPPAAGPAPNPMQGASTAAQGRMLILSQLASSPDVSATTREWAQTVIKALVG